MQHGATGLHGVEFAQGRHGAAAIARIAARERLAIALCRAQRAAVGERRVVLTQVRTFLGAEHADALADEVVGGGLRHDLGIELRGAVAGLGDAVGGDRVGAQELRHLDACEAGAAPEDLEEVGHRVRVEPRVGEQRDADAVGLVFIGAGEVDLLLHRGALRDRDTGLHGIAGAGRHSDQDGGDERGGGGDALATPRLDGACDMPLGDMRDLVREHARELRLVRGGGDETLVEADEAPGQREGVDARVAHHEEPEPPLQIGHLRGDPAAERLDVIVGLGVLHDEPLFAQTAHHGHADAELLVEAERRVGRRADIGQVVGGLCAGGGRCRHPDEQRQHRSPEAEAQRGTGARAHQVHRLLDR